MTAPLAGARLNQLGEDPSEMALVGKAAGQSDLGQRQRRVDEQLLCLLDPLLHEPAMWWLARHLAEGAGKMARRELAGARQFRQRYRLVRAWNKHFFCSPQLPGGQSAARRAGRKRDDVTCLLEVGLERRGDVIGADRAHLRRPGAGGVETESKVMNHWIIGPVASIEADDWVDAAPLDQRGRLCDFDARHFRHYHHSRSQHEFAGWCDALMASCVLRRRQPSKSA